MKPFDEVYETLPGNGWLSRAEAECLYRWAAAGTGPILEVGCFKGRSSVLLAATGRQLTCVDPFAGFHSEDPSGIRAYIEFHKNLTDRGYRLRVGAAGFLTGCPVETPYVTLMVCDVGGWSPTPATFAYLDGDHTEEGTRVQVAKALEAGARVIAVHDVNDSGDGEKIKHVCLKMLGVWKERVERLAIWERP